MNLLSFWGRRKNPLRKALEKYVGCVVPRQPEGLALRFEVVVSRDAGGNVALSPAKLTLLYEGKEYPRGEHAI